MGLSEFLYQKDTRYMCFLSVKGKVKTGRMHISWSLKSKLFCFVFFYIEFFSLISIPTVSLLLYRLTVKNSQDCGYLGWLNILHTVIVRFSGSKHCSFLKKIGDDKLLPMVLAVPLRSSVIVLNFLCHRIWEPLCWEKWSLANWIKERR